MNQKRLYLCTRPSLAALLIGKGYTATKQKNPWNESRDAWTFDLTPPLADEIEQYFHRIGKGTPGTIVQFRKEMNP